MKAGCNELDEDVLVEDLAEDVEVVEVVDEMEDIDDDLNGPCVDGVESVVGIVRDSFV